MKKFLAGLGVGAVLGVAVTLIGGFIVCEVTETVAVPEVPTEHDGEDTDPDVTEEDFA